MDNDIVNSILQSSLDAIIMFDDEQRILEFNAAAERMLGHSRGKVIGKPWTEAIIVPSLRQNCLDALGTGPARDEESTPGKRLEITAQRADGSQFPAEITLGTINLRGQRAYAVWLRDMTERRQLENQLWRSQRMEAVGRLAGGVAHDFNNLLTVIAGYSDLLLMGLADNGTLYRHVEEIKKAGERAASLTHQLLAFSRRQVMSSQVVDLNAVITGVDKMLRRLIGEDIELLSILEPVLGPVKADPAQLEQVLMNLAVNSRDAMPDGGRLILETSNVTMSPAEAASFTPPMPDGKYVMLTVSDTGDGMDPETESHIFEPFFTTKEEGKGTGLGLATVYGIVKQSEGYIWVSSELGRGTTFKIYLPRAAGAVTGRPAATPSVRPAGGTETILVAEDETSVRELICNVLESAGYALLKAARGPEAIEILDSAADPIDLLITDVVMPQMSGFELAEKVVAVQPETKIVYMSGYTERALLHRGLKDPDAILLQKPFTPDQLVRTVRDALDSSSPSAGKARR